MSSSSRRGFLKAVGTAVAAAVLPGQAAASAGWHEVQSPTSTDLHDVTRAKSGTIAVGGGGTILVRSAGRWTARRTAGINGRGRNLTAAAATNDGKRVWIAGDSGALAAYEPGTDRMYDVSAPGGYTGSFADVAVAGPTGTERVRLADESGRVHVGVPTENQSGAERTWSSLKPGGGATLPALAAHCRGRGYAVDTNGRTYALSHGEWTTVGETSVNLRAVAAVQRSRRERSQHGSCRCRRGGNKTDGHCDRCQQVVVAGGNGTVAFFDGNMWARDSLESGTLRGLSVGPGSRYAVGDGGAIFVNASDSQTPGWQRADSPTGQTLRAVSRGSPLVAVGDSGTILEK